MSTALHLVKLELDPRRLYGAAQRQRVPLRDLDVGYAVHAQLAALFQDHAPKPFHVADDPRRPRAAVTVLGYAAADSQALRAHAEAFCSDPTSWEACNWSGLSSKPMPAAWRDGQRVGYRVRVCPVVRAARRGSDRSVEVDAYLAACDLHAPGAAPPRAEVYAAWLARQLEPRGVRLLSSQLERFELASVARRRHGGEAPGARVFTRPDATFTGVLEVRDAAGFAELLARGVGRHRAFGFGMLLLRPAPAA